MSSLDRLARRLTSLERQVSTMSSPQLARSAIVEGAIDEVILVDTGAIDELGNPIFREETVARYGQQEDGSHVAATFDGPKPPRPVAPLVTAGPGYLSVTWTGEFEDAFEPYLDHDYVAVHVADTPAFTPVAATLVASIRAPQGESVVVNVAAGTWYVSLVAVAVSGRWSDPAPYSDGAPGEASGIDVVAREMAQDALDAAESAETAAAAADRIAREGRALADAVSAAANTAAGAAIDAGRTATVTLTAANGFNSITYSPDPPGAAAGRDGDTWYRVGPSGDVIGLWECTSGDGDTVVTPATQTTPPAVAYSPTVGTTRGTYTVPSHPGVDYLIDRTVVAPGEYQDREGPVAVVARARAGYVIPAGVQSAWVGTIDPGDASTLTEAFPAPPAFSDYPGPDDEIVLAASTGVVWFIDGAPAAPGVHPASGTVTVSAAADTGYFIDPNTASEWTHTFNTVYYAYPTAPVFSDLDGSDNDAVTITPETGVTWRINGQLVSPGTTPAAGAVTVTAHPDAGWAIPGTSTWTYTFDPLRYVTPTAPTWDDTADTFTIATQTGVSWRRGGEPIAPGTYTVPVNPTIAATDFTGISNGQSWPAPWAMAWRHNAACVADVQSSQGRILVAGTGSWQDKLSMVLDHDRADFDITYKVRVESANGESWHHFWFRCQQPDSEPKDGYDILFARSSWGIYRINNWSSTPLATYSLAGMALATDYWVRVQAVGPDFKAKLWTGTEPGSWTLETSDTAWTGGRVGFHAVGGSSAAGYTHRIDDITLTDPTATGDPVTVDITAHPATGYALTGATAWSHTFS